MLPVGCQRSQEAERRGWREIAEGRGREGGGGSGGSRARESGRARSGARRLASPQLAQNTQASPCALEEGAGPPLPAWLLLGLRGPACARAPLESASPALPPSACSARRPPRSARLGCWGYNGEQERPPPLFPRILQPSGWSPRYLDLPGKTEIFLMVGPNRDSLVD
ncbi:hypothetical protein R6Z07F_010102 [Ovis aries]